MRNMISTSDGFQYAVNIEYDLGSEDKLKSFIPTNTALSLLEDILLSTSPKSNDRARILIGAYGKGKSHILLTILSILLKKDLDLFEKLCPKIRENSKLKQLVNNYYDSDNKILPVVINGSNINLTQSFLFSLQRTLAENNLLSAMPETNYKAAIETINRWKNNYEETYKEFSNSLDEPVETFIQRLDNFDILAYETFEQIYPKLTAGSTFNPFLSFDVVELYESVAKSLKEYGYSGIYVVYDEFSKFLEANITKASVNDIKMLQDFAEKCNRSGDLQMHIMLISHKEISNYIDKLPKEKTDGWRGVSERFKHVRMNDSFSQTYEEIIPSVIQHKEPLWNDFQELHINDFKDLSLRYGNHEMFKDDQNNVSLTINNCFPLHPVSTFILPRLSEKVAQNERTLFTFLSTEGSDTLGSFLNSYENDFSLITPDKIYDYFEPLFKKEVYSGNIHEIYILTRRILNQIPEDSLESKIVKTIALLYILDQFERLKPTKEEIIGIFSNTYTIEEIEAAISNLEEQEFVLYLKRSNDYLKLKETSGVNVWQKIQDLMESESSKVTPKDILNSSNYDNYMLPSGYNDEFAMTRYFNFQFISSAEVSEDTNWELKSKSIDGDGFIFAIIPESEEDLKNLKNDVLSSSRGNKRQIFVIPKSFKEINQAIFEFNAVTKLRDEAVNDPVLFEEYQVIYEDLQELINDYIHDFTRPENNESIYIHDGVKLPIYRKSGLTKVLTDICNDIYFKTPIINNEVINKNEITTVAQKSRNKIIHSLLHVDLEPNLGFKGNGQEVSIMRSTLVRPGILKEENGITYINLKPMDFHLSDTLLTIENFVLETRKKGKLNFKELYDKLTLPDYNIGLRKGVIPIYLAAVLHNYRQQIIIYSKYGQESVSMDTLVQINSNPENFDLEYLNWDPEKETYVGVLAEELDRFVVKAEKAVNAYEYAANALHRWYMALPKYSKECKRRPTGERLDKNQLKLIKLLHDNVGGSELLFKKIPKIFGTEGNYHQTSVNVLRTIYNFDDLLGELKQYLIIKTREVFLERMNEKSNDEISLMDSIQDWCDKLDQKSFEQLFSDGTDRFLKFIRTPMNDEEMFIAQLAKLVVGLRLENWNSKTTINYFEKLSRFIQTAEDFHSEIISEKINDTSNYELTYVDDQGKSTVRRFNSVEISNRGKLLFNQINASLDAMGQSITEQEKRQVLMEVLKTLC